MLLLLIRSPLGYLGDWQRMIDMVLVGLEGHYGHTVGTDGGLGLVGANPLCDSCCVGCCVEGECMVLWAMVPALLVTPWWTHVWLVLCVFPAAFLLSFLRLWRVWALVRDHNARRQQEFNALHAKYSAECFVRVGELVVCMCGRVRAIHVPYSCLLVLLLRCFCAQRTKTLQAQLEQATAKWKHEYETRVRAETLMKQYKTDVRCWCTALPSLGLVHRSVTPPHAIQPHTLCCVRCVWMHTRAWLWCA